MQAPNRDAAFMWDMLTFAREVQRIVAATTREEYLRDRVRQLAVERAIEIIGEAARQVSDDFQAAHPEVPCRGITVSPLVLGIELNVISSVFAMERPATAAPLVSSRWNDRL